jgi:hypothetical protein
MRWVVVRAVRFMTPLWQILTLKRSPGTRTGLFAFNSRIVGKPSLIPLRKSCPLSANDQQTLGDMALLIWPFRSTRRLPEAFL